ncbi:hypothetical protein H4R18_002660 [Coemansia javaensis]|uniref:HAM1-like N-terminal domain-containing protein n=1 Tax=Coemansia javaensis TaxID=2761396 RepID=A0A9W8HEF2_9FUNG|nr:hypothetical protein H4R18_002660 [Coemansia javaensis]
MPQSDKSEGVASRPPSQSDISPGGDMVPLDEYYKPKSTRARFEELASTYRRASDRNGKMLVRLDQAVEKKTAFLRMIQLAKNGELPPTQRIVGTLQQIDFDKMRTYPTTFQGKKVVDHMETATRSGIRAFEEINGEDGLQNVIESLDSARRKTADDRKLLKSKAKNKAKAPEGAGSSAGKDMLILAKGVGTSASFRKLLGDLFDLANDAVQGKLSKGDADAKKDHKGDADANGRRGSKNRKGSAKGRKGSKGHGDAKGHGDGANQYASDTGLPLSSEDEAALLDRMRDIAVEVRKSTEMRRALSSLHALYTTVYGKTSGSLKDASNQFEGHPAKDDLEEAYDQTKALLSRLGGGYDMSALATALSAFVDMTRTNKGFKQVVDNARDFAHWTMDVNASELTSESFQTRGRELIAQSQKVLSEEERATVRTLSTEAQRYMHAVGQNPVLVDYRDNMVALAHYIMGHGLGKEERREHHRALRRDVLANLPVLMQEVRYVPLPRIAGQNKDIEFAADNVVLDLKGFVPEHMSFDMHDEAYPRAALFNEKAAARSGKGFCNEQFYSLRITGVHFVAEHVAFYVKKKRGFPRIAEKGIANLVVKNRGLDVAIKLRKLHCSEKPQVPVDDDGGSESAQPRRSSDSSASTRSEREFDIVDVRVKMRDLDIVVHENKHTITSALALTLMKPTARHLISRSIARALTDALVSGDRAVAKYGATAQDLITSGARKAVASGKAKAKAKSGREEGSTAAQSGAKRRDSLVEEQGAAPVHASSP